VETTSWSTTTRKAYDAYQQGHRDACKDERCALLPDSSYPSFRDGIKAGEERVRQEVALLIDRVRDLAWKATQYGTTEDGDTAAYIVPKGALHRLVGEAQAHGFTTVALRDTTHENTDRHPFDLVPDTDHCRACGFGRLDPRHAPENADEVRS
jgi:hypothetical protein